MAIKWPLANIHLVLSWIVIGILGMVEGIYGRTQYYGDWISYLNVSWAVTHIDWREIFNPFWNPGYPALVAAGRALAAPTPEGEWYAITVVNWMIYLLAYASWRGLIRNALALYWPGSLALALHPFTIWIGVCVFLGAGLALDPVSAVCPDLLVTTGFLLGSSLLLSLIRRRDIVTATLLGLVLGLGIWVKGVFTPFSCLFILTLFIYCCARGGLWRPFGVATGVFGLFFATYVAGISWSYGELTLGASGALNVPWHVNELPHLTNWQGGPEQFGRPIHPTSQLVAGLPAFGFGTPFHTTYPPYNDVAYWYKGFRSFFSLKLELIAMGRSLWSLQQIIRQHPIVLAVAVAFLPILVNRSWRASLARITIRTWPLLLPTVGGFGTYFLVHVEERYLSAFIMIVALLSWAPLIDVTLPSRRMLATALVMIYGAGAVAELAVTDAPSVEAAIHRADFHDDPRWRLANALTASGLRPGDAVAVIRDTAPTVRVSWAYVSRLRIVAEFGGLPYRIEPQDRNRFDRKDEILWPDFSEMFWTQLTPQQRDQVMKAFSRSGARAVVSLTMPKTPSDPGWVQLKGTSAWLYRFADTAK
ncbi:hypothetical protein [Paraburkholderia lycopersici]|uniref:Dolichyl-phosphate-mannose-protein mannosyltransferase n=1 Tax=Paraburkholderia lycopersici TaxID=416944 RepID=A0A1G6GK80_9BURK|nr:hypothetical protein [Paraburkholderia lycopersici]SDB82253.1 hypothetical protein SAMN05421548_10120 [Paraburkholderia lycopersici]